jgi:diacylglycerol kinase (ATP)
VRYLLWTQRNARIHCAIGVAAVILGLLLRITRGEWLVLVLSIALVLATEGVNTAIEAVVDLVSPYHHPLAKIAKDVAAGTVLLVAIASVIIGLIIFLPYMLPPILGWLGL